MAAAAPKERKIITDKVVVEKTGKTMEEWFAVLDKKGAKKLDSHVSRRFKYRNRYEQEHPGEPY